MKAQTRLLKSPAGGSAGNGSGVSAGDGSGSFAASAAASGASLTDAGSDAFRRAGVSLSGMKRIRSRRAASGTSSTITRFERFAQMRAKPASSSVTRPGSGPQLV